MNRRDRRGGQRGLAVSPSDASPEEAPRSGDLETAKLHGKRVAEIAARLVGQGIPQAPWPGWMLRLRAG